MVLELKIWINLRIISVGFILDRHIQATIVQAIFFLMGHIKLTNEKKIFKVMVFAELFKK